ncbi:hypothetical protein PGTUg99_021185 [Puccinia graminis f. sp. tritici]|uniref:CCHC-type domain-containing protein n=1 Tax=Puccinia graminis f. sp. tritici TaxID=56615 RepID=A0A5B0QLL9_PUCGR|nr:hypothetical protein PGTUg99_021185 [Puccinia graminis f. sp. tritici]
MSGLSNRACFKCGALGHLAEQCPAESRLCYNCKQSGHESASCPNPRTGGVDGRQCFTCGGFGHLAADCPSATTLGNRIAGVGSFGGTKCYTCGQFGHVSRSCNHSGNGVGQGAFQSRIGGYKPRPAPSQPVQCYKCQGMNHYARDCMAIQPPPALQPSYLKTRTCFNCQQPGHIASNCPVAIALAPGRPSSIFRQSGALCV